MNYELHCKYFHSKLWHLKAHRKNPVSMVVLSNNDFHFNCRQQQMTKNKMDFYLTLEFFQRTNNSEEMDFNTKPELRVRTHLRSLFINLRPVWLQSDDSVEFVQGQVSILYVLAGWQELGGEGVWGGVGQLHSHSPPQSQKEKEKKGHLTTFHLWRAGREKAARWNLHWLNCTMTHCHLRLWLSAKLSTAIVQGTKRIPEARGN